MSITIICHRENVTHLLQSSRPWPSLWEHERHLGDPNSQPIQRCNPDERGQHKFAYNILKTYILFGPMVVQPNMNHILSCLQVYFEVDTACQEAVWSGMAIWFLIAFLVNDEVHRPFWILCDVLEVSWVEFGKHNDSGCRVRDRNSDY